MKAGTTIFLAMIILIAFGFVISEYNQIRIEYAELKLQVIQAGKDLETCQSENQACVQNGVEKDGEIDYLKDQLTKQVVLLNDWQARYTEQESLLATCAAIQAGLQETISSLKIELAQKGTQIGLTENQPFNKNEVLQRAPLAPEITDLSETNPLLLAAILVTQVAFFLVKKVKG